MGYLDNTGLAYFWEKIKSNFFAGTFNITAGEDLNNYRNPGVYRCASNTTAEQVSNVPIEKAFSLQVYRTTDAGCRQVFMPFGNGPTDETTGRIWLRSYYNSTWSDWCQIVTSLDRPVEYTSAGWTDSATIDTHKWHKIATFVSDATNNDRRAIFTVTDSYWSGANAPYGRPDKKFGVLHVHIRKTVGSCAPYRRLTWNLNTGFNADEFLLVYNPNDDTDELWTRLDVAYLIRTFNLIECGHMTGGNRYRRYSTNTVEMYGRTVSSEGSSDHPDGEGFVAIEPELSDVMQPSKGIRALEFSYAGNTNGVGRLTSANTLETGGGIAQYFNATSSMAVSDGKPTHASVGTGQDSHLLHLPWDGTNGYDSQLAVPVSDSFGSTVDPNYVKTVQWRGGYGNTTTLEDGKKIQTGWSDWHHLIDDQFIFDGIRPDHKYVMRYGVCSTAADVAVKTVDIPGFELYTGAFVIVSFTNANSAAVAQLKLNVSNTGDIPIKHRNGNFPAASEMIANRPFMFVYDGTNWQLAIDIDHNTNNFDRLRTYYAITAKAQIKAKNIAVADNNGLYFQLQTGTAFSLKYAPLYVTSTVKANKTTTNAYYFCWCEEDAITACAAETLVNNKAVYIKGNVVGDTFVPFAAQCLVCTEPVTEDGYQYYKLGVVKESATRIQIEIDHPIFEYVGGAFRLYQTALATNTDIDALFN